MKITKIKLLQLTILLSVLILLTISRHTNKNSRKHKQKKFQRILKYHQNQNNNNINNYVNSNSAQDPQEDPIVTSKRKCKESCDKELEKSKNVVDLKNKIPTKDEFNLYIKKIDEDIEYYLCECLLSDKNSIVKKEFYFANKSNVDLFLKNDDDGRKVYKKMLKKGLSDSDNGKYKKVNL
jgi:hypothetical protein